MEYKQIQELIKFVNKSNISELSIEEGEFRIKIKQGIHTPISSVATAAHMPMAAMPGPIAPAPTPAPAAKSTTSTEPESKNDSYITVNSPMIGTFYRSSSPDKPPFIQVGDEISVGQVTCIIEAMKLFNEIESEISGRVVKILAEDASPVEYDQPLFLVEPV